MLAGLVMCFADDIFELFYLFKRLLNFISFSYSHNYFHNSNCLLMG